MNYNKIMYEQLTQLLRQSAQRKLKDEQIGKSLDILRKFDYFSRLNSNYGADYLILLLQTLQPFILREGFGLIHENDHYMLLQGELAQQQPEYQASRRVDIGKILDLNEKKGLHFIAKSDCRMLRLKKGPVAGFHIEKKLSNLERQRKKNLMDMQKMLGGEDYKKKYQFLQNNNIFSCLGEYDFMQLITHSQLREYNQGNVTHKYGDKISMVGYILIGKINVNFVRMKKQVKNRNSFNNNLRENDWIGLQEFLWKHDFMSNGQVISITSIIIWIPIAIFQSKFNPKTNYCLLQNLTKIIEARKMLMERSLSCRKQNQQQLSNQASTLNSKLLSKIQNFQFHHEKRKNNFRRGKTSKIVVQIPEIMHRINFNVDTQRANLKKLNDTNLFPDQFRSIPICSTHLNEMQRLQKIRNSFKEQKINYSFTQKNPSQLFRTILEGIPKKIKYSPSQIEASKTSRQYRSSIHYNMSIYNNFRVNKQGTHSPNINAFKTLELITKK